MKLTPTLATVALLLVLSVTGVQAGERPADRVVRLAMYLKLHYSYRDFNDYGAVAYGKVYELSDGLVNVYYSDSNENLKVDDDDSLHIVDESGETILSFVDQGLNGISDEADVVSEVNAVGAAIRPDGSSDMNEHYFSLVDSLLRRR